MALQLASASRMAHITDLPSELLLDIFDRLCSTSSTGTMTAFLLCCRDWHDIAASVLYTHVAVDSKLNPNSALSLFTRQRTYLGLVQSLTLRIHQSHLMGFSIKLPKAYDRLDGLNTILPNMSNLKSFSLVLEEQIGRGYVIPSDVAAKLLKSLPETVVNLELDSYGLDDIGVSGLHLCKEVGALIPRLQCLRLRLSHLCPSLLAPLRSTAASTPRNSAEVDIHTKITSPLRVATIRLDMKPDARGNSHSCLCGTALRMKKDVRPIFSPHFAKDVNQLHQIGAFPYLQRFIVIERLETAGIPFQQNWDVWKVRDITNNSTTTFPWCARGGSSHLYMIRDLAGQDLFGGVGDISSSMEGLFAWTETLSRSRLPPRKVAAKTLEGGWQLETAALIDGAVAKERHGVSFALWENERNIGVPILWARTSPGFEDTTGVREMVPRGWKFVPDPQGRQQYNVERE